MSTPKFTKGPLGVSPVEVEGELAWFDITTPEGCIIGMVRPNGSCFNRENVSIEEAVGNAYLWRTAPDMYAALECTNKAIRLLRIRLAEGSNPSEAIAALIDASLANAEALTKADGKEEQAA